MLDLFYFEMHVFMLEGNLVHVRFVLLCIVGVCARNKSSTHQICFILHCLCWCFCFTLQFFFICLTLDLFYLMILVFVLEKNIAYIIFVLPYNYFIYARNKSSVCWICFTMQCFNCAFVLSNNAYVQFFVTLELFYLTMTMSILETNLAQARFILPSNVCVYARRKFSVSYICFTLKCWCLCLKEI